MSIAAGKATLSRWLALLPPARSQALLARFGAPSVAALHPRCIVAAYRLARAELDGAAEGLRQRDAEEHAAEAEERAAQETQNTIDRRVAEAVGEAERRIEAEVARRADFESQVVIRAES